MRNTTLCYIIKDGKYLMLHRTKKQNDINREKWIGIGGGFIDGETPQECVTREMLEETGLSPNKLNYRGIINFTCDMYENEIIHLFTCNDFSGRIISCDEGELEWVIPEKLKDPSYNVWEGDFIFLDIISRKDAPFFQLTLSYSGSKLIYAALDGVPVTLPYVSIL